MNQVIRDLPLASYAGEKILAAAGHHIVYLVILNGLGASSPEIERCQLETCHGTCAGNFFYNVIRACFIAVATAYPGYYHGECLSVQRQIFHGVVVAPGGWCDA